MGSGAVEIEKLTAPVSGADLDALAALLIDAVESGAAVSFILPLPQHQARAWWEKTLAGMHAKGVVLVTRDGQGAIVGSVQLHPAWAPNQPHRADVAKLLVHRRVRGGGLGRRLMEAVERAGADAGFRLLTLDAKAGGVADRLYASMGWVRVGIIPRFAVDPDGVTLHDDVLYYKELAAPAVGVRS